MDARRQAWGCDIDPGTSLVLDLFGNAYGNDRPSHNVSNTCKIIPLHTIYSRSLLKITTISSQEQSTSTDSSHVRRTYVSVSFEQ